MKGWQRNGTAGGSRTGEAWNGTMRQGEVGQFWNGEAASVKARYGQAGKVSSGKSRSVQARRSEFWFGRPGESGPGWAWNAGARRAWLVKARNGNARKAGAAGARYG